MHHIDSASVDKPTSSRSTTHSHQQGLGARDLLRSSLLRRSPPQTLSAPMSVEFDLSTDDMDDDDSIIIEDDDAGMSQMLARSQFAIEHKALGSSGSGRIRLFKKSSSCANLPAATSHSAPLAMCNDELPIASKSMHSLDINYASVIGAEDMSEIGDGLQKSDGETVLLAQGSNTGLFDFRHRLTRHLSRARGRKAQNQAQSQCGRRRAESKSPPATEGNVGIAGQTNVKHTADDISEQLADGCVPLSPSTGFRLLSLEDLHEQYSGASCSSSSSLSSGSSSSSSGGSSGNSLHEAWMINDDGIGLLSESINRVLGARLDETEVDGSDLPPSGSGHSSSSSTISSGSSAVTLSDSGSMGGQEASSLCEKRAVDLNLHSLLDALDVPGYSEGIGSSPQHHHQYSSTDDDVFDYDDLVFLEQRVSSDSNSSGSDDDEGIGRGPTVKCGKSRLHTATAEVRRWWPKRVLPVHNMQYMPKLSRMVGGCAYEAKCGAGMYSTAGGSEPAWSHCDADMRDGGSRGVDYWDILSRCPMRPTSALALSSLKEMVGSQQRYSNGDDADSDEDDRFEDAASAMRGSRHQLSSNRIQRAKPKQKRVLSEPMQYILYNSYLRYYGGEKGTL
ncbi:hypothetical protein FBU59_000888 [Linderina macrospora]|uniref:Uncharacterized protein n=1 Tax=Linderina macrospora TaxID=4868 RepID=A0ACC1JFE2_9FUNG|nr:hypothetical protein FBU59_000888 [Linderina macrospora]